MMREQVISTSLSIQKAGQAKHFQIKLPKNTKHIIGIELGGRWLAPTKNTSVIPPKEIIKVRFAESGLKFKRDLLIGELKLQSCEEANIFYSGHLQIDNNAAYCDFSGNTYWTATAFTHQSSSFEERVVVDGRSTILHGIYKDRYGENNPAVNYLLNVYVWIEIIEPNTNKR
jgi:hypothetical protein